MNVCVRCQGYAKTLRMQERDDSKTRESIQIIVKMKNELQKAFNRIIPSDVLQFPVTNHQLAEYKLANETFFRGVYHYTRFVNRPDDKST